MEPCVEAGWCWLCRRQPLFLASPQTPGPVHVPQPPCMSPSPAEARPASALSNPVALPKSSEQGGCLGAENPL